jgi:capsular polysaccharide biosynthesis protein
MSEQALDLRRSVQVVRRYRIQVGAVALIGLLAGTGYAASHPPPYRSESLVLIAESSSTAAQATTPSGVSSQIATEVIIADSDQVLAGALPQISPPMSLAELSSAVSTAAVTNSVFAITATGTTATDAESVANAVANSYVKYVNSSASPVANLDAQVFETANGASGGGAATQVAIVGLIGLAVGALIGYLIALFRSRGDRRLRRRDEIANSIGVPVIADFPVVHPSDANGWKRLLDTYDPSAAQAWRLRTLLDQMGISDLAANGGQKDSSSLTVLTLSTDAKAVALGPQLATFAASVGILTTLVVGPQQVSSTAATLRAACAADAGIPWSRQLRTVVSDDGQFTDPTADLVVVVMVVDGGSPRLPETVSTSAMLLGVSAGGATADQLASAAAAAAADGHEIAGIIVADPEPEDKSTGRIPRIGRSMRDVHPNQLKGIPTETIR